MQEASQGAVKRWISLNYSKGIFKVGKVRLGLFFHNNCHYSVVTKYCPNVLHLAASWL